jgi:hypothetical protein
MDFVVSNPAWLAIILFGVVSIISGIMLTGRDLDPIERVLPSISGIQKWCGIGIFMAAIIVFVASPLTAKHLYEAEKAASDVQAQAMADQINAGIVTAVNNALAGIGSDYATQVKIGTAIATGVGGCQTAGYLTLSSITSPADIQTRSQQCAVVIGTQLATALPTQLTAAQQEQLTSGISTAFSTVMGQALAAHPGVLTHKSTVTFYNPLSNVWATMLGIFGILILVFSQITAKYGDQKPLSTMLACLWPVIIAMCYWTWELRANGSGDVPGVMLDTFIMLALAAIALPLCILGMREKPREAGEWAGYAFIILGIDGLYIGIKYLWLFEVQPFLHMSSTF